jgi:hypothetical protein
MGATQLSTDAAIAEKRIRSDASPEMAEIIISEMSSAIKISLPLLQNLAVTLSIS